ncbi:MAG: alpha/beta fold hydrolase [Wenzhouxiangella sp.]
MNRAETHRFQRAGGELFYRSWRSDTEGPALVMLHGLASNSTRWRELAECLTTDRRVKVFAPDLRGHGHSVYRGRLRRSDWVEDLSALIEREGCRSAVIGGHCLGANLALRFALERPEQTAGLVLVEPMLPGALTGVTARIRPVRWLLPLLAAPVRLLNVLGLYRRRLPVLDLTELDCQTRAAMAEHESHDAMLERYARPTGDLKYMPVATYLQALYQVLRDVGDIGRISAPVLALLSNGALLADPERSRRLLGALPAVEIEQFDALHWIPTEQPEAMTRAIGRFMDRAVGAG